MDKTKDRTKKGTRRRRAVQISAFAIGNSHVRGLVSGTLYTGSLKRFCFPGMNCYSCPSALLSCPIGALQAVLSSPKYSFSAYLSGFFLLTGVLLARFACGFLCPFGLFQEILHAVPFPLKLKTFPGDRPARLIKYGLLLVFAIAVPLLVTNAAGGGFPAFCKWICPVGTLEAGVVLMSRHSYLASLAGALFAQKAAILAAVLLACLALPRAFCRYLCPLGAIYGLFNGISIYRIEKDESACNNCGICTEACPMALDPSRQANHPECVRCGNCQATCPRGALKQGFFAGSGKTKGKANAKA